MAIKYYDKYPQRWESPSNDYPQGAFKNLSAIGKQDGSYLEKDWLNDQSGFFGALLRNAEMTPNGLVDTAQKSQFYEALIAVASRLIDTKISTKQDKLTFVGDGPEVMKKGAGGWLGNTVGEYTSDSTSSIDRAARTCVIRGDGSSHTSNVQRWGGGIQIVIGGDSTNNKTLCRFQMTELGVECLFKNINYKTIHKLYSNINTRTDKNNVLHAGTTTPINTLNVSDMSQEVINNDLLTVTSGAVYRALQPKSDLTYVNTELSKKWDIQQTVGEGSIVRESSLSKVFDYTRTCALGAEQLILVGANPELNSFQRVPENSVVTRLVDEGQQYSIRYRPIIRTGW